MGRFLFAAFEDVYRRLRRDLDDQGLGLAGTALISIRLLPMSTRPFTTRF